MREAIQHDPNASGPVCQHCGYLLRGVRSAICVECGRERVRRLTFLDRMEFDAFRAAFDLAGVPHEYSDPSKGMLGMETVAYGLSISPMILLTWRHIEAAEAALEAVGLSLPVSLVDEEEPYCPCCGFALDRALDEVRCGVCGTRCAWYDEHGPPEGAEER